MILKSTIKTTIATTALLVSAMANAQNYAPPTGAILDLNGQAITGSYINYSVDFTAALAGTDITFAIRNDPSWSKLTNVVVTDITNPGANLIDNGTFLGTGTNIAGWTYDNEYGAAYGGTAENGYWYDGATDAYDAIDQVIATNVGDTYQISFSFAGNGDATYSDIATANGSGNDLTVYAQGSIPPAADVPEPSSLALMGLALAALFVARRSKSN